MPSPSTISTSLESRIAGLDWQRIAADLDAYGCALTGPLLDDNECAWLKDVYEAGDFRSKVIMARHGFGSGEYKYFAYPLPEIISTLRERLYEQVAPTANRWSTMLGLPADYPASLAEYLERCHAAGQLRPTPLLLRYGDGDYNCLHQDLYGDLAFPLQATFLLDQPGTDFTGGSFVVTEQRPRMQSRAEVLAPSKGEGMIFAVNHRPVKGTKGFYRVTLRHGVSRLTSGTRATLGIIFHDAH